MLDALDAAAVQRWSHAAVDRFDASREEIDALNVFPVADRDTGTNMLATLRAADSALGARPGAADGAGAALAAMAEGAARGAVGNSGFILSQVLRGLADAVVAAGCADAGALAAGLARGARLGRLAVVTPVDGTILTVVDAAAHAAGAVAARPAPDADLAATAGAALAAAVEALQRTPGQLAALAEAGVVDAGGSGLVLLLTALADTVGTSDAGPSATTGASVTAPSPPVAAPASHTGGQPFAFEVQYLLDAGAAAVEPLRRTLAALGDSVAVVPVAADSWKVHAHVDDVGAAIEAGVRAGRPHGIEVVRFPDAAFEPRHSEAAQPDVAVVAVAPGAGLAHLFEAEGVHVVEGRGVEGSTTQDIVAAIEATGARSLVLLPNASRVTGVTESAAALARDRGLHVAVVPTRSPVQGLAAVAVHDPGRRFDDDVVAMAEAGAATRFAQVMVAQDQALTAVGMCQPGDVLGLIDGEVVEVGRGLLAVAFGLVDRLLGVGVELMTLLVGQDAPRRMGELVEAHVRGRAPFTDVTVYEGGQPDAVLIIGAE